MLADLERYSNRGGAASSSGRGGGGAGAGSSMPAAPPSSSSAAAKRLDSLRPPPPAAGAAGQQQQQQEQSGGGFKAALDKVLIVDFFFVLFALAWLVAGVATNGAGEGLDGSNDPGKINGPLLSSWFALWPMVFQPAIGILMAGALVSGGVGWLRENKEKE